ncbi:MAG TPA: ATP-dependent Clp protease proteolytic subunit [bacterium]|nr:ATP-dependent Clp protease proteolytic subunit [bacterium]HPN31691.1 ATP-dependent Clp protease proteolytic subunit [bacterium]
MCENEDNEKKESGFRQSNDTLKKTRTIIICGEITQKLAEKTAAELLFLQSESETEPVKIILNSQGGHVESGDTIHDMIKFIKPKVIMIGTGWVASAGITIYLGADKKRRYSLPNTRYLIHQPSGGMRGQTSDIEIETNEILKMRKRLNRLISDATGQAYERIEKDSNRNFWLSAEEAKEYGIVDSIITNLEEINKTV